MKLETLVRRVSLCALLIAAFAFSAASKAQAQTDSLRVQLASPHQAQFAGFYAAQAKGYYARHGLSVQFIEGDPKISPLESLAEGRADLAVAWLSDALLTRQRGLDIVNIAQIFQRSNIALACPSDTGVETPADLRGKRIAVWKADEAHAVRQFLAASGIPADQVTLVERQAGLWNSTGERFDCAAVTLYSDYWSTLDSGLGYWSTLGQGLKPEDLKIIRFGQAGSLEDGLYVRAESLQDPAMADRLRRFLLATEEGWRYAREHREEALGLVIAQDRRLSPTAQRYMLNSVLRSIGEGPFGLLDLGQFERTRDLLAQTVADPASLLREAQSAWTHRIWSAAGFETADERPLTRATAHYLSKAVASQWFYILDLIGTVAFGLAGFMRAQQRRYDLWGAFILTLLPAVGGGTLRDLLIGGDRHPPFIFNDPTYIKLVAAVVVIGTVVTRLLPPRIGQTVGFARWMTLFDTIGLATFAVVGAKVALVAGLAWYWVAFCAALTCAGGGMLLDIVTGREPRTFQGEPYEEIAVGGGLFLYGGLLVANHYEHAPWIVTATILATLVLVFAARLLLLRFGIRTYRLRTRAPQTPSA